MQCVGFNDDANDYLLDMLEQMNVRDRSNEVFLLALYRAVSIERFDHRSKLILAMEVIFSSKKIPSDLIDVFEDIIEFYKALSEEVPMRFQKEGVEKLLINASEFDKLFYMEYQYHLEYEIFDKIKYVKWAYECLMSGGRLVSTMERETPQSFV